jgi:hypothetical protein
MELMIFLLELNGPYVNLVFNVQVPFLEVMDVET